MRCNSEALVDVSSIESGDVDESRAHDFGASQSDWSAPDTLPPSYQRRDPFSPPLYEQPPVYGDAISENGAPLTIHHRVYAHPRDIRLSPLEVSLLKEGIRLPFLVAIPRAEIAGTGLVETLKWMVYKAIGAHRVELTKDDVDDYGRWAGSGITKGAVATRQGNFRKWLRWQKDALRDRNVLVVWISS